MNILIGNGSELDRNSVHGYRSNWIYRFNRAYGPNRPHRVTGGFLLHPDRY
jgi:hypothetical protein